MRNWRRFFVKIDIHGLQSFFLLYFWIHVLAFVYQYLLLRLAVQTVQLTIKIVINIPYIHVKHL